MNGPSLEEQLKTSARRNTHRLKSSILFLFAVLLLTKLDFLVNNTLYEYGLRFSDGWYREYTLQYALSYQLILLLLYLWNRDWKLIFVLEGFVLSSGQDLIYFAAWQGGFPQGQWTWMIFYEIFGYWNTSTQILLTVSVTLTSFILASIIPKVATTIPRKVLKIENPSQNNN